MRWEAALVPAAVAQAWGEVPGEACESARREPGAEQRWRGDREGKGSPAKLWEKGKMLLGICKRAQGVYHSSGRH